MIISHFPGGGNNSTKIEKIIEYSGVWLPIDDGDDNWRVKFFTSGTLTVKNDVFVDVFAVGGGGNGGKAEGSSNTSCAGGGGGGGYTKTVLKTALQTSVKYIVTVGAACGQSSLAKEDGTIICQADGGISAGSRGCGGAGGSGGGPGGYASNVTGLPGSDGGNATDTNSSSKGGTGQGTTTREFGESDGDLYSGGGGGGRSYGRAAVAGAEGGGGDGGTGALPGEDGAENTGGGGGGGGNTGSPNGSVGSVLTGGTGGSGIVIIRNMRIA